MRRPAALALLFAGALACSRRSPDGAPGDAAIAARPATPSASASASASPTARPERLPLDEAQRSILMAWSDALDRHDLPALERIYAPAVEFYGHLLPRATVLEIKKRALGPRSTYRQSIVGEPALFARPDGGAVVPPAEPRETILFVKRTGEAGKMRETQAQISIRDGLVIEETDARTEPPVPKGVNVIPPDASSPAVICEQAASTAVNALPAVQEALKKNQTAVATHPGTTVGGLGPIGEPGGGFSASIGIQHASRYEATLWYTVDANGALSVTLHGEDLAVPAASLATVARACARP